MDWMVVALVEPALLGLAGYAWYRFTVARRLDDAQRTAIAERERAIRAEALAQEADRLRAERAEREREIARHEANAAALEARRAQMESEAMALADRAEALATGEAALAKARDELAGMTREEAEARYLASLEPELRRAADRLAARLREEAEVRARSTLLTVIERTAVATVAEATTTIVSLPSEDLKGRLIGREGRNVRAFEQTTGVDLLIDETPDAVVLSCFDPIRRETARLTLDRLIAEGKIHPARIEAAHAEAKEAIARVMAEAGALAAERAGVRDLPETVVRMLGRLRFRTSVGQNVLDHVVECAMLAGDLAAEIGADAPTARRAALLHDIGKALEPDHQGPHALSGARFLAAHGESEAILHAVAAHHRDVEPASETAGLVIIADALSAARPGARRDNLEQHVRRLTELEELARSFEGVERAFALEAGRDLYLIVRPDRVDDEGVRRLADEVAARIERTLEYPGQIKVTVIRETRAWQVAR